MAVQVYVVPVKRAGQKKATYKLRWKIPAPDTKRGFRWREESARTSDKVEANSLRRDKFRELNGIADEKAPPPVKLSELGETDQAWLENRGRSEGTTYLSGLALTNLRKIVGDVPITKIGPQEIEAFIASRRAKLQPKSVNRELGCLRATFNRAVKVHKLLKENPFAGVEMMQVLQKAIHPLTREQEKALLKACKGDLELDCFVRFALDTGCRAGEISHVLWKNVDLKECTALVECTETWQTKTRRNRFVAFTPKTAAVLAKWKLWRKDKPLVFGEEGERSRAHYYTIRAKFTGAAKRAKLSGVTLHDLRRTVGTLLAERGVSEKVAAEFLGHRDVRTTAQFYQTVRHETIKKTARNLRTGTGD